MIVSWTHTMAKIRVNPGAVCRQLITHLKTHKPLTADEEGRIVRAIERSGVENATNRMLAQLSRNTLNEMLNNI